MALFTKEEIAECSRRTLLEIYCHAIKASWKWFTANEIAEIGPGIISYAILTAGAAATAVTLYDGVDNNGQVIVTLETTAAQSRPFAFHDHLIFKQGLYVEVDANILGILLVWHPLPFGVVQG